MWVSRWLAVERASARRWRRPPGPAPGANSRRVSERRSWSSAPSRPVGRSRIASGRPRRAISTIIEMLSPVTTKPSAVAEQAEIGVVARPPAPTANSTRSRRQPRAQRLDQRERRAPAGGEVGRAALRGDLARLRQQALDHRWRRRGTGRSARRSGTRSAAAAAPRGARARPRRRRRSGPRSTRISGSVIGEHVGKRRQLGLGAGDHEIEALHHAGRLADQHEPGAAARLLGDPERHHRGPAADRDHEVGPGRLERVGARRGRCGGARARPAACPARRARSMWTYLRSHGQPSAGAMTSTWALSPRLVAEHQPDPRRRRGLARRLARPARAPASAATPLPAQTATRSGWPAGAWPGV